MESITSEQIRRQLRACIFNLVQRHYMRDSVGLHLLRVVEMTLRQPGDPVPIGNSASLYIEDGNKPDTWRAYPSDQTTVEELARACEAFDLRVWVDLDGRVCMVMRDNYGSQDVPPDAEALVGAMYGAQAVPENSSPRKNFTLGRPLGFNDRYENLPSREEVKP